MMNKNKIKIILSILTAFLLVFLVSGGETKEMTPKTFVRKIINSLPKNIAKMIYQEKKSPSFATVVLSKEKLKKTKLSYNNEDFEAYIDPNIELTQEEVKMLYYYWKLVNKRE